MKHLLIKTILILVLLNFGKKSKNKSFLSTIHSNLLPQGWAFFTEKPTYPLLYYYKIENNSLTPLNINSSRKENLFGLKRNCRRLIFELSGSLTKPVIWKEITKPLKSIDLSKKLNEIPILSNDNRDSKLTKGNYLVLKKERVKLGNSNKTIRKAFYIFKVI